MLIIFLGVRNLGKNKLKIRTLLQWIKCAMITSPFRVPQYDGASEVRNCVPNGTFNSTGIRIQAGMDRVSPFKLMGNSGLVAGMGGWRT